MAWGGALWSGFDRMGGVQGLEAFDKGAHRGQRALAFLLRRAGQRGLQLGAQARQGLQIDGMGKSYAQPGFIVPQLTLSDLQIASRLVALRSSAGDQPFDGIQDGARAVHVPGEWG